MGVPHHTLSHGVQDSTDAPPALPSAIHTDLYTNSMPMQASGLSFPVPTVLGTLLNSNTRKSTGVGDLNAHPQMLPYVNNAHVILWD